MNAKNKAAAQEPMSKKLLDSMTYSALAPKSICTCGHLGDGARSQHIGFGGHGSCIFDGDACCNKFSWKKWHPEYVAYMKEKGHTVV